MNNNPTILGILLILIGIIGFWFNELDRKENKLNVLSIAGYIAAVIFIIAGFLKVVGLW